jgi:hypothetical protein
MFVFLSRPARAMTVATRHARTDPADDDLRVRAAVFEHLLRVYPAWLTEDELTRAVGGHGEPCARAVRDLAADGLVHRRDAFVLPTQAAVASAALLSDAPASAC